MGKIDELLLTKSELYEAHLRSKYEYYRSVPPEQWNKDDANYAKEVGIAQAQIEKIKNNLPEFEEIRLKIIECQFGGMEVPQLREWLKENLLIKEGK